MSATSELKALVKQLQHSSTEQVRLFYFPYGLPVTHDFLLNILTCVLQEIIGILQTLKREAKITEGILRVSLSPLNLLIPLSLQWRRLL